MDKIALLPGFVALFVLSRYGLESAFLNVYLPTALLLPWFHCVLPGVPDPTFSQAAMLPIVVAFFWRSRFRWRFSAPDLLVLAFAVWAIGAEYLTSGFTDAQNISFDSVTQCVIAYLFGKELIKRRGLETQFARRFVFLMFLICAISIYEFRMQFNPFKSLLIRFFPNQGVADQVQVRLNVGRIAGPFSHSIVAGVNIMIGILINSWLIASGKWERYFRFHPFPLSKGRTIAGGLIAGSLMTISRGPWIGGIFGFALTRVGASRNPRKSLALTCMFCVLAGAVTWTVTKSYTSVDRRAQQLTEEQDSAAYRSALLTEYTNVALSRPLTGWGKDIPVVGGMKSIDNAYLLMMLSHGVPYVALFGLFLVILVIRLVWAGLNADPERRAVLFMLAGVFVSAIIALGTVWLPPETEGVLFLLAGWAEGCVIEKSVPVRQESAPLRLTPYNFQRVYA